MKLPSQRSLFRDTKCDVYFNFTPIRLEITLQRTDTDRLRLKESKFGDVLSYFFFLNKSKNNASNFNVNYISLKRKKENISLKLVIRCNIFLE